MHAHRKYLVDVNWYHCLSCHYCTWPVHLFINSHINDKIYYLNYFLFYVYVSVFPACMSVHHVHTVSVEARSQL